ncbi:MAG: site-specific integrase [Longimicrobiales bacterium]|nr:site-specific integrase [Longimicrobiales bacterium]
MPKLTKTVVDRAKSPKGDPKKWSWLGDEEVRGFGVKFYPNGRRTFALRYRTRTGRQRMFTLGEYGTLTVQQARDMARREKVRVLDGDDPQAERQREAVVIGTMDTLMTRWIDDYANAHRRRWKEDKGRVDRHIRPAMGRLKLEDLTPDVLASWHRTLGKKTPVEANRCLETLRAAWRWADAEGLLTEGLTDPTRRLKKFREHGRDRWLRKAEVKRLMEATAKDEDPYVRAAVPLFLLTGLRKRELLTALWSNVDLDRGELQLPETKTGVAQVRLLPGPAVRILRDLPRMAESPYVFPSPSNPTKPRDDIKKPWARIREEAGLEDVTLHDLRRTAGSHMAQAGVPLQVIGEVLGHSHPGVTKLYARLASENERQALDTLSDALSGVLGLSGPEEGPETLQDRLRGLLEAAGDDPDALVAGLRELGVGRVVEA